MWKNNVLNILRTRKEKNCNEAKDIVALYQERIGQIKKMQRLANVEIFILLFT